MSLKTTVVKHPLNCFRLVFAAYFIILNSTLLWNAGSIFGSNTLPKNYFQSFYDSAILQSIFNLNDSVFIFICVANIAVTIYFLTGKRKRLAMSLGWFGIFLLFIRMPIARSIQIPFIGFLLALSVFIPDESKKIPKDVAICAWALIGINYLAAAIAKFNVVEWKTGDALFYIFQGTWPRQNTLRLFLLGQPLLLKMMTYATLLIEGVGWTMFFSRMGRKVFIILSALFHLGILLLFRLGEISTTMLIFQLFLYATLQSFEQDETITT